MPTLALHSFDRKATAPVYDQNAGRWWLLTGGIRDAVEVVNSIGSVSKGTLTCSWAKE